MVFGIVSCVFRAVVAFVPNGEIGATGREVMVLVVVVLMLVTEIVVTVVVVTVVGIYRDVGV